MAAARQLEEMQDHSESKVGALKAVSLERGLALFSSEHVVDPTYLTLADSGSLLNHVKEENKFLRMNGEKDQEEIRKLQEECQRLEDSATSRARESEELRQMKKSLEKEISQMNKKMETMQEHVQRSLTLSEEMDNVCKQVVQYEARLSGQTELIQRMNEKHKEMLDSVLHDLTSCGERPPQGCLPLFKDRSGTRAVAKMTIANSIEKVKSFLGTGDLLQTCKTEPPMEP